MAVLWPSAIGKPDDTVIFYKGTSTYRQNEGLNKNKDGDISKGSATENVINRRSEYEKVVNVIYL